MSTKSLVKQLAILGLAFGLAVYGGFRYYRTFSKGMLDRDSLSQMAERLREKVIKKWKTANEAPTSIVYTPTISTKHEEEGITFEIKVQRDEVRKFKEKPKYGVSKSDPFLPPFEPNIFVDAITDSYRLLLNQFCIAKYHTLVVSNKFEKQETPLTPHTIEATLITMKALSGFAYYNSGQISGASQPHRHVQVIPYSEMPESKLPIEVAVKLALESQNLLVGELEEQEIHQQIKELPGNRDRQGNIKMQGMLGLSGRFFTLKCYEGIRHLVCHFGKSVTKVIVQDRQNIKGEGVYVNDMSKEIFQIYARILKKLDNEEAKLPYNLVLTPQWMLIVIREAESADIGQMRQKGINSMGFAGSIFAKSQAEAELIKEKGVLNMLREIGAPMK